VETINIQLPTATIENGTISRERWVLGTLATIGRQALQARSEG
jgi:siroheme synthase